MEASEYARAYFVAVGEISAAIDAGRVDIIGAEAGGHARTQGLVFIVGVGGGAGQASRAINDFRKPCLIESHAPTDSVPELTPRTNDDGWGTSFAEWLSVSVLGATDALLVFSAGGSREQNVSM